MTRCVEDAAIVLSIIAGKDANDDATLTQPPEVPDFTRALSRDALKGKRLGVPRRVYMDESITKSDPSVHVAFDAALDLLSDLGADVVNPTDLPNSYEIHNSYKDITVLEVDFNFCALPFL